MQPAALGERAPPTSEATAWFRLTVEPAIVRPIGVESSTPAPTAFADVAAAVPTAVVRFPSTCEPRIVSGAPPATIPPP